jgi:hypothetical protein
MLFRVALVVLISLVSSPAQAQFADQQAIEAVRNFRLPAVKDKEWQTHQKLTDGLAGRWFIGVEYLVEEGAIAIDPVKLRNGCAKLGTDITVSRYEIKMHKTKKIKDGGVMIMDTTYVDRGSNAYGFMTNAEQMLAWFGIAYADEELLPSKYEILRAATGFAYIFRPSSDVLAIYDYSSNAKINFAIRCE